MDEVIKKLTKRVDALEKAVFKSIQPVDSKLQKYTGAKGGSLLLLSKGYFSKFRTAQEVKNELANNDYHYNIQVIQTTLNRLSKERGLLVGMKESGKKTYVKRK